MLLRGRAWRKQMGANVNSVNRRCVMKRTTVFGLVGTMAMAVGLVIPMEAEAIPAFARLYGHKCSACHSAFPALNATGEEFRL